MSMNICEEIPDDADVFEVLGECIHDAFTAEHGAVVFPPAYAERVVGQFYFGCAQPPFDRFTAQAVRQLCHEFEYAGAEDIIRALDLTPEETMDFEPRNPLSNSVRRMPEEYSGRQRRYWQDVYETRLPACVRDAIDGYVIERNETEGVMHPPTTYDLTRVFVCFQLQLRDTLCRDADTIRDVYEADISETELLVDNDEMLAYRAVGTREWYVDHKDWTTYSMCGDVPTPLSLGVELSRRAVAQYKDEAWDDRCTAVVIPLPLGLDDSLLMLA